MLSPAPTSPTRSSLVRRAAVGSLGGALCATGVVMMVLPGPGVLMLFLGLAVLSREYPWARRSLERISSRAVAAIDQLRSSRSARLGVVTSAAVLVAGGAVITIVTSAYRYLGVSAIAAGLAGLAVLIPAVQQFVLGTQRADTR